MTTTQPALFDKQLTADDSIELWDAPYMDGKLITQAHGVSIWVYLSQRRARERIAIIERKHRQPAFYVSGNQVMVHHELIVDLAQWASTRFRVWVSGQLAAIIWHDGKVAHREHAEAEFARLLCPPPSDEDTSA